MTGSFNASTGSCLSGIYPIGEQDADMYRTLFPEVVTLPDKLRASRSMESCTRHNAPISCWRKPI